MVGHGRIVRSFLPETLFIAEVVPIGGIVGTYVAPVNREPEPTGKHSAAAVEQAAPAVEKAAPSDKTQQRFADLAADGDSKPLAERETTVAKDWIVVFK